MSDVSAALVELRGVKSTHKVPMRTPILSARISAPASVIANLKAVESDLTKVSKTESLTFLTGGDKLVLEPSWASLQPNARSKGITTS
ncbi:valyl-tRNA synthetase [Cutibacterium acnes JCM 18920]|nr:valyl-tRNA synthetase [Cutibacterium acnes JCM 18920]